MQKRFAALFAGKPKSPVSKQPVSNPPVSITFVGFPGAPVQDLMAQCNPAFANAGVARCQMTVSDTLIEVVRGADIVDKKTYVPPKSGVIIQLVNLNAPEQEIISQIRFVHDSIYEGMWKGANAIQPAAEDKTHAYHVVVGDVREIPERYPGAVNFELIDLATKAGPSLRWLESSARPLMSQKIVTQMVNSATGEYTRYLLSLAVNYYLVMQNPGIFNDPDPSNQAQNVGCIVGRRIELLERQLEDEVRDRLRDRSPLYWDEVNAFHEARRIANSVASRLLVTLSQGGAGERKRRQDLFNELTGHCQKAYQAAGLPMEPPAPVAASANAAAQAQPGLTPQEQWFERYMYVDLVVYETLERDDAGNTLIPTAGYVEYDEPALWRERLERDGHSADGRWVRRYTANIPEAQPNRMVLERPMSPPPVAAASAVPAAVAEALAEVMIDYAPPAGSAEVAAASAPVSAPAVAMAEGVASAARVPLSDMYRPVVKFDQHGIPAVSVEKEDEGDVFHECEDASAADADDERPDHGAACGRG